MRQQSSAALVAVCFAADRRRAYREYLSQFCSAGSRRVVSTIVVALALLATGVSHLYDGINIYNDGLPPDSLR